MGRQLGIHKLRRGHCDQPCEGHMSIRPCHVAPTGTCCSPQPGNPKKPKAFHLVSSREGEAGTLTATDRRDSSSISHVNATAEDDLNQASLQLEERSPNDPGN